MNRYRTVLVSPSISFPLDRYKMLEALPKQKKVSLSPSFLHAQA